MIHMENKDLHVAIVLSPICGPKSTMDLGILLLAHQGGHHGEWLQGDGVVRGGVPGGRGSL